MNKRILNPQLLLTDDLMRRIQRARVTHFLRKLECEADGDPFQQGLVAGFGSALALKNGRVMCLGASDSGEIDPIIDWYGSQGFPGSR